MSPNCGGRTLLFILKLLFLSLCVSCESNSSFPVPAIIIFGTSKGMTSTFAEKLKDIMHFSGPIHGAFVFSSESMFWHPFISREQCRSPNNYINMRSINRTLSNPLCSVQEYKSFFPLEIPSFDKNPDAYSWPHFMYIYQRFVEEGTVLIMTLRNPAERFVSYARWYHYDSKVLFELSNEQRHDFLKAMRENIHNTTELIKIYKHQSNLICLEKDNHQSCQVKRALINHLHFPQITMWIEHYKSINLLHKVKFICTQKLLNQIDTTRNNFYQSIFQEKVPGVDKLRHKIASSYHHDADLKNNKLILTLENYFRFWNELTGNVLEAHGYERCAWMSKNGNNAINNDKNDS